MAEPLVIAEHLSKQFGDLVAVDDIDFQVRRGEVFGFLGPNGAGKSSTMRMIGAVSPVGGGNLTVLGMDPATEGPRIRARLGVVPQDNNLDEELTVYENLLIYGRYYGLPKKVINPRIDELLAFAQLEERRKSRVEPLSGGMKRRLTIARGLITTHYMDEAEQLCDRLVIMDKGKIVAHGSPRQLIEQHSTREVLELRFPVGTQEAHSRELEGRAVRTEILPDRVLLYTNDAEGLSDETPA